MIWKIIGIYIVISTIVYFFMGGFFFTRQFEKKLKFKQQLRREFQYEKIDEVFKGIYAGIVNEENTAYHFFQFPGLLIGNNRLVNIYYDVKDEKYPIVEESSDKITGTNAYLILHSHGYYSGHNKTYEAVFKSTGEIDIQSFTKTLDEKPEKLPDTLFVVSLTVMDNNFKVEIVNWTKDPQNGYQFHRYKPYQYTTLKANPNIRNIQRKSSVNPIKKIGVAIADILTGIFQALIILLYFAYVIIKGGPLR